MTDFVGFFFVVVAVVAVDNLQFDDLRAEQIGDGLNIVLGRDAIHCGYLGSKQR